MALQVLEMSLDAIRLIRQPLASLRARNPDLHDQIRRAASSVPLNLAEGWKRSGKDRRYHWRIAAGSAEEARTALRVAEAWGELPAAEIQPALQCLDSVLAMLWKLTGGA